MNTYDIFRKLIELCQMRKLDEHSYSKMIQSGELNKIHCDYGTGFYDVSIYYLLSKDKHVCRIYFSTSDDGSYGSWTEYPTKELAISQVEKAKDIFSTMVSCPSEEELNKMFLHLGLQFGSE